MTTCPVGHPNPDGARFCNSCGSELSAAVQSTTQADESTRTETFTIPVLGTPFYRAKLYTKGVTELCARLAREGWQYDDSNKPVSGATVRVHFVRSPTPRRLPAQVGPIEVAHFGSTDFNLIRRIKATLSPRRLDEEVQQWRAEAKANGWIVWFRYRYTYDNAPAVLLGYERPAALSPHEGTAVG